MTYDFTATVNAVDYEVPIEPHRNLLSVLRTELGLTGTKEGCDDSECGACMVLVDGRPVNACSYLALQACGSAITTVEGLADATGGPSLLQQAFIDEDAAQCGFCTPGMLISAEALLSENPRPSEAEVRLALGGNLCRCTGYTPIVDAVMRVVAVSGREDEQSGQLSTRRKSNSSTTE